MQLMFADIWQSLPPIIKEAASSPLGIFALMIIALAILAFFFFKEAGTKVKFVIFVLLFLGVVAFAAKIQIVYKAREVAAQKTATAKEATTEATPIPLPDDTGWIFAGYFDKDTSEFVEGPYVESIGTHVCGFRKFVEIGDTVRLKVSRPVIIVGYKTTQTSRVFESP